MKTPIEPFYSALGRRVFELRTRAKLTQAQLGQQLPKRMTRAGIANIETGKQRVLAHQLVDLARVLSVDVAALIPRPVDGTGEAQIADIERNLRAHNLPESAVALVTRSLGAMPVNANSTPRRNR